MYMLNYNSNLVHVNSSDTDTLHYWQLIIEVLSFLSDSVPCWILSHWDFLLLLHFVVLWLPYFMSFMEQVSSVTPAYSSDRSMLEYEVQASSLTVFCQVEHSSEEEDTSAWQSPMVAVTLFYLLRRRPWFYFQVTYQLSHLRHEFSYDCSML